MPIQINVTQNVGVSSDSRGAKDLGNVSTTIASTGYNEGGTQKMVIKSGEFDRLIPLDDIQNVGFISLKTYPEDPKLPGQTIGVRFNDVLGELREIHPMKGKTVGLYLWTGDAISSLYVTNAGTANVVLLMVIAGD